MPQTGSTAGDATVAKDKSGRGDGCSECSCGIGRLQWREGKPIACLSPPFYGAACWHDVHLPCRMLESLEESLVGCDCGFVDCGGTKLYGDGPCGQGSLQNVRHEPKINLQSAMPLVQPRSLWCEAQAQLFRWRYAVSHDTWPGGGGCKYGSGASLLPGTGC